MRRLLQTLVLSTALVLPFSGCTMNDLPRNMDLSAFNPHRKDFVCKHEADAVPPIDPEAERWFQQGLAATGLDLPEEQRDYKKAAALWQQAAERRHWKAMINLATLYAYGRGVERSSERAVQIVEEGMRLGIPAAFDLMGTYHREGRGVNQDSSRAYAFWQLAADMGSPSAQAYLGKALKASYDNPEEGFWGNRPVGLKMLECGFAQGHAQAAYTLGYYARALFVLHEAVKFGSQKAAGSLFASFDDGKPLVNGRVDRARAERYRALSGALFYNPDLRFPNLDKVLPLLPARLPQWDMSQPDTLIDAAKAIVPAPPVKPTPGAQRTGRAHIPQGYALPSDPVPPAAEREARRTGPPVYGPQTVPAQPEGATASYSGYWRAQLNESSRDYQIEWNQRQLPLRYMIRAGRWVEDWLSSA